MHIIVDTLNAYTLPTPVNDSYQQRGTFRAILASESHWLQPTLRSLVASTSRCGEGISVTVLALSTLYSVEEAYHSIIRVERERGMPPTL
jgi:hypothetical protein